MRKTVVAAVAAVMIVGIAGAAPAQPHGRAWEQEQSYALPNAVGADTDIPGIVIGHFTFDPGSATHASITIEDATAPATLVQIRQNDEMLDVVCTSSSKPTTITPNVPLEVVMFAGACDNTPSFATTGVVTAHFTKH